MKRPSKMPPYVQAFVDRHGRSRYYFRKAGAPRIALPGMPWTPEFMAAYSAAKEKRVDNGAERTQPGTLSALAVSYYRSPEFLTLRPITQSTYRNVIERFRRDHGEKPVALLQRDHVKSIMGKFADRPAAANQWLKVIRILMRHAVDRGMRKDDPTTGIRKLKTIGGGYRTWTEEDITAFYAKHPIGTRERLALDLLLFTGQRRGDVVRLGRQNIRNGSIVIRQSKTGAEVVLPYDNALRASIEALPTAQLIFLVTAYGKPFTAAGFTNWFREAVVAAGLPGGLSAHGLRKAACRRLAEAGSTAPQLMAVSGHKTLAEAQKYIEAANRAKLAAEGMAKVTALFGRGEVGTQTVKPNSKV